MNSYIILKGGAKVFLKSNRSTTCRGCGAKIFFAYTEKNGKLIPINELQDGSFEAHFASCPNANDFRKYNTSLSNKIREEENNQEALNNL